MKNKETVLCPFSSCDFKTSKSSSFTAHKSRYHNSNSFQDFKKELLLSPHIDGEVINTTVESDNTNTQSGGDEYGHIQSNDDKDTDTEKSSDIKEKKIKRKLCSLLLRPLGTEYRRQLSYKSSFELIEPVEYELDDLHKRTFVYVTILIILPKLLNN